MFGLKEQKAKLSNVNLRSELHGDEHKLAVDLSFEAVVSNDVLSEFHPSLKSALYVKGDDVQGELLKDASHLPAIRFDNLGMPLKWNVEMKGYEVVIHHGIGGPSDIKMIDCQADTFRFDCKDGGSVGVKFRVIAHPTQEQVGIMSGMIQQDIDISLTPPEEQVQQQQELGKAA